MPLFNPVFTSGELLCTPSQYAPSSQVQIASSLQAWASLNAAATTVASGSNGGEISTIASWANPSSGVLDVASTAGWPTAGTFTVATSSTTATCTYTGLTSATLTGCAYVSGSATGTVATGGAVTLTAAGSTGAAPSVSTGSFVAPASGTVIVEVQLVAQTGVIADAVGFALAAHGSLTLVSSSQIFKILAATDPTPLCLKFVVGSLTAGTAYNFDLLFGTATGGTVTVFAVGLSPSSPTFGAAQYGAPVVMTVQAV